MEKNHYELPKGNVHADEIAKVLAGDVSALYPAFSWVATPQGHNFWSKQVHANALTDEGYAILKSWLEQLTKKVAA